MNALRGKLALLLVGAALGVAAAIFASAPRSAPVASAAPAQTFVPPSPRSQYGEIRSLTRKGARYELRFDPAFWLSGLTANRAAEEDGAIRPGEGVPNDYYIRDERKRALTYRVPASARVTVVTSGSRGLRSTRVPVSEFAELVKGRNPKGRQLLGRPPFGVWIRVALDTVRSIDEQYRP
jgi:hypothetical protein